MLAPPAAPSAMRPISLAAVLLVTLPACVAGSAIREGAEPFVEGAFESHRGLQRYLLASGVEIASVYGLVHTNRLGVVRAGGFDFSSGGRCQVFTYETANDALQLGPKNSGEVYVRTMPSGGFGTARQAYRPTIQFGNSVAACNGEDARVRSAFLGLRDYADAQASGDE